VVSYWQSSEALEAVARWSVIGRVARRWRQLPGGQLLAEWRGAGGSRQVVSYWQSSEFLSCT